MYLRDTDGAGVVYFLNFLAICHEAYEESLAAAGVPLEVLPGSRGVVMPVVYTQADFRRPLFCGDHLEVTALPRAVSSTEYELVYTVRRQGAEPVVSRALTRHVCIDPGSRQRQDLPPALLDWLARWGEPHQTSPAAAP